jgi:hypothetical protein
MKDVDGRDKLGHDENLKKNDAILSELSEFEDHGVHIEAVAGLG